MKEPVAFFGVVDDSVVSKEVTSSKTKFMRKMVKVYKALRVLERNKSSETLFFSKSIEKLIKFFYKKFPESLGFKLDSQRSSLVDLNTNYEKDKTLHSCTSNENFVEGSRSPFTPEVKSNSEVESITNIEVNRQEEPEVDSSMSQTEGRRGSKQNLYGILKPLAH